MNYVVILGALILFIGFVNAEPLKEDPNFDSETNIQYMYDSLENVTEEEVHESNSTSWIEGELVFCRSGNQTIEEEVGKDEIEEIRDGIVVSSVGDKCGDDHGVAINPNETGNVEELEDVEKTFLERLMDRISLFN